MRVVVVVAAMLFCMTGCSRNEIQKGVAIEMELIDIPAGKFTMGSPEGEKDRQEDEAQVSVTLTKPFGLGKTEVTQGQWKSVMESDPWKGKDFISIFLKNVSGQAGKDCPATCVDWDDATAFCQKLTLIERKSGKLKADEEYRLPTEAEWEYSCRAGTETAFSFGDDESKLGKYAWFEGKAMNFWHGFAHKVGLKKPNPWGLHDMHGNVHEWCSDWYGEGLSGGTDPAGPEEGSDRVFRGGCWGFYPGYFRSASRGLIDPSARSRYLGFRVARSQSETVTAAERRQQGAQAKPDPQVDVETRPGMEKPEPVKKVFKGKIVTNSIGMKLVPIQAGEFLMGSPANEPLGNVDEEFQHPVQISKPFLLGMHEVTQSQYEAVASENPSFFNGPDLPVEHLSWNEAQRFCKLLSELPAERAAGRRYRLPTEAEWEYVCRAGTTTPFNTGEELESEQARFARNNRSEPKETAPVGSYPPNAWGLFDMHGNVWEWTADWFSADYFRESPIDDPQGPATGTHHTLRGGSASVLGLECHSAFRGEASVVDGPENDTGNRFAFYGDFGIRVVCEIADKQQ